MKKINKNEKTKKFKKDKDLTDENFPKKNIQKYDIFKLQSLLEDLEKKDLEYDLIIQGLKEKINRTKHENNNLEKEIEQLKLDNNDINKMNKRLNFEYNYKRMEIKNKNEYNKNMEKINEDNGLDKYKEELNKNKELKNKIANIQQNINNYQNRLYELESILNYTNPEIQKQGEEMKKCVSEL